MKDMTSGTPIKQILLFSIPLIIGNIFQLFYNMVDTFIVGRTMGVNALAGIGAAGSVMFFVVGFSQGFTAGTAIPTAQAYGARDYEKVSRSVAINWVLSTLVVIVMTALSVFFLWDILYLMNTPAEIIQYTYDYLIIIFGFMAITILFNMLSNLMRALGDSRTPVIALVIAVVINIILDYVFILVFDMGAAGVATATMVSQLIASLICLFYIQKKVYLLKVKARHFKMRKDEVIQHCRIGFPMAFQSSIIAIGSMSVTIALNTLGAEAVAGYSAAQKIDQIVVFVLMSFGVSMATYVGQNFGAKKYDRILRGVKQVLVLSISVSILFSVVLFLFGGELTSVFGDSSSKEILRSYGQYFFQLTGPFYWILAILFVLRYTLQGLGDSFIPTVAGVMELTMRIIAAFGLSGLIGFAGPVISNPMAWLGAVLALVPAYYKRNKKLVELQQQKATQ
ncbi:MATE family efflux transporter [Facklamia tabacinasalis]|uniref:MATE family efflux transporter n=2 Tax=Ruoffia tabacinasalis TaxID=87458 RepID=A0ABS0LK54_9LACT|nr:MATE family efflux transporter [Ruoffia tabacinasalis]